MINNRSISPQEENDCSNKKEHMHFDRNKIPDKGEQSSSEGEEDLAVPEPSREKTPEKVDSKRPPPSSEKGAEIFKHPRLLITPRKRRLVCFAIQFAMENHETNQLTEAVIEDVKRITHYSRASIFNIWSESEKGTALEKLHCPQLKVYVGRKKVIVDQFEREAIRLRVFQMYKNLQNQGDPSQWPTVNNIHKSFENDMNAGTFPKMSTESFHKLLHKIGFKYGKRNQKQFQYERPDITTSQHSYLQKIKQYHDQGYQLVWQDETWANANATHERIWQLFPDVPSLLPAKQGIGGLKTPSGAGRHLIINHAGGEMGFLPCPDIFVGKTGNNDYHTEMNSIHCLNWFANKLLPAMPPRSVIIIDNAKYHNQISEETKKPTQAWRKNEIQQWLQQSRISFHEKEIKAQLLEKAKSHSVPQEYQTDKIAREYSQNTGKDIKVLRLPIGHCELNPIELIWAQVKMKISDRNRTFKIKDVLNLAIQIASEITPHDWQKCIEHVLKIENEYWEADALTEVQVEPLVIDLNEVDTDDDENEETMFVDSGVGSFGLDN